jgi:NADH dehydrogenase FAD-containing subunit
VYPDLVKYCNIMVYDVAPKVLSMFDENLGKYATQMLRREGVHIRTSRHVEELRRGFPSTGKKDEDVMDERSCWTLKVKEGGELGVGMVVWSTGLMMNPFVENALSTKISNLPRSAVQYFGIDPREAREVDWVVKKDGKTGGIITDEHLRVLLEPTDVEDKSRVTMEDVFALGDCATIEGTQFPATAQVASQKAEWLGKRLNKGDVEAKGFRWNNMGVMA